MNNAILPNKLGRNYLWNTKTQRHEGFLEARSKRQEKLCVFVSLCSVKIIPSYFLNGSNYKKDNRNEEYY